MGNTTDRELLHSLMEEFKKVSRKITNSLIQINKMKKLLGIVVLGLLKYHPIDYGRTRARLEPREINS